jgi:hypothetical protein
LAALEGAGRRGADVSIALPGLDVVSTLTHFEAQGDGFFAAGPVTRSSQGGAAVAGEVSFTVVNGTMSGRMVVGGRLYRVSRLGLTDLHEIQEIDVAAVQPDGQPVTVEAGDSQLQDPGVEPGTAQDSGAIVDLLVMYTPAARLALGGTAGIQAEATAAVNNANLALQNSGVSFRYRTVFLGETSYTESGNSQTDLSRLAAANDGYLDEVHTLRDTYKADVVSLLTEASDVCGIAYVMTLGNVRASFNTSAFNVTIARNCASANLSLAHEVGHNMGLHHDRPNAGSSTPATEFAYGYAVPSVARDVMAYACDNATPCPRRTVFSSPLLTFPSSSVSAGTATEDNARALNLTAAVVSNFRVSDSACSYALSSSAAVVGAPGGSGTVTVTTASGCPWSAISNASSAVSISTGATFSGSGTVGYTVGASSTARTVSLTIAGQTFSISQVICSPTVALASGMSSTFAVAGGAGTLTWTFPSGCSSAAWSVSSNQSWVSVMSATTGAGTGSASFAVAANTTNDSRAATLTLSGPLFSNVSQALSQSGPTFTITVSSQSLTAVKGSASAPLQAYSAQQAVALTLESSRTWTATSDQPWLEVVNGSGTGSSSFYVRIVNPNNVLGGSVQVVANITIAVSGLTTQVVPFTLNVKQVGQSATPFGFLDTPVAGTTVSGAIPVTGWALGSDTITRIDIWRDAVPGDVAGSIQTNGWVYIGQAAQVTGARPDVAAAFASYPQRNSAGWGYLLLTNMLPHRTLGTSSGGQGAFRLHVTATQANNVMMELGDATVTVDNESATRPFGAIDTPSQGGTASSLYANFGWALAKGTALIPVDGSTMTVFVDGVPVGRPTYNQCRGTNLNNGGSSFLAAGGTCDDDIATLFRSRGHLNVAASTGRAAIGSYVINTTTLTNGLHSIAWSVTDNQGRTEGIGSRNFIVANGTADETADPDAMAGDVMAPLGVSDIVGGRPVEGRRVSGRRGFDLAVPWEDVEAGRSGVRHVRVRELDRVEFDLGGPVVAGFLAVGPDLVALPVGSHLDARGGRFTWAPAAGFLGRFDLVFLTATGRIPVSVDIVPKTLSPEHDGVRMHIDAVLSNGGRSFSSGNEELAAGAGLRVEGWALDPQAWHGAGVGAVHVWVTPVGREGLGAGAVFLGAADLGGARPDVATAFGAQFDRAGFTLESSVDLPPGDYEVTAYIWCARTGRWEDAVSQTLRIR